MRFFENKKHKKLIIWISSVVLVLAIIVGGCAIYVSDYYRADTEAIAAFGTFDTVERRVLDDGSIAYVPQTVRAGFIFYPGGKVEHTAYEPLMLSLAESGVLCVLVEMPFRLAVLDVNAADGVKDLFPEVESWYIGGHSLGGSMAASYLGKNSADFEGLVLLAAYSTEDLSDTELSVLSLYGSEDGVMNREKYEKNGENLPITLCEVIIEGGCHAYFGMYGEQKGDGTPTISCEEQIKITAEEILFWMLTNPIQG